MEGKEADTHRIRTDEAMHVTLGVFPVKVMDGHQLLRLKRDLRVSRMDE